MEDGKKILSWTKISKAKRLRDTAAGGPEWKSVVRRTTYDAVTGSSLDDVAYPAKLHASRVFAKLPGGGRRMIRTVFLYSPFPDPNDENIDETPMPCDVPKAPPSMRWKVILLCTDEDSLMEQFNPYPGQCEVIHITVKDDFTSEGGFKKVLKIIEENANVAMLVSFPCTGGCLFNVGINSKRPECSEKLLKHWTLFRN